MTDRKEQLIKEHGADVVECYESYFPGELELFDDRYCGRICDVEEWAQGCLEDAYAGFDEADIPCLESWLQFEFPEFFIYDEDVQVGFTAR
jgi:hypothetical protein